MTLTEFCWIVFLLCRVYELSVVSWGRTEKRNADKGGLVNSWHLRFLAVDVVADDARVLEDLEAKCQSFGLELVIEEDCWHIEPRGPQPSNGGGA